MNILACVKRVPATGGRIGLTDDARDIDTRYLGFVVSPHEECAVEEAVRIVEAQGGSTTVLTLGPAEAADQLRDAMAIGVERAVHLQTDGSDWDPVATAAALTEAIRVAGGRDRPVRPHPVRQRVRRLGRLPGRHPGRDGARPADRHRRQGARGRPAACASVRREAPGGWEVFDVPLPAVVAVREGLNLPRYPSVPGRLRAKKKEIDTRVPARVAGGPELIRLVVPVEQERTAEILGTGPEAAPRVVEILRQMGVL